MFFKRRSRANSYVDNDPPPRSQSYDDYDKQRPDSSSTQKHQQRVSSPTEEDMYPRPQQPQETQQQQQQFSRGVVPGMGGMGQPTPPLNSAKPEPMPDLLAQAFNQAVRPYTEKIEQLESQLADMQAWIEQLEQQRAEVHGWIDKRGLRPGTFSSFSFECPRDALADSLTEQTSRLPLQRSWTRPPPMQPSLSTRNSTAKSQS